MIFIRHAQSWNNAGGVIIYPNAEIPLTELGKQQALDLITKLPKPDIIFVSEFIRTQQTAQPYAEYWHCEMNILSELNEFSYLNFADIQNKSRKEFYQQTMQYWENNDPNLKHINAESFQEFISRVKRFLQLINNFSPNTICFGHGLWLTAFDFLFKNPNQELDMKTFYSFRQNHQVVPNASIHFY